MRKWTSQAASTGALMWMLLAGCRTPPPLPNDLMQAAVVERSDPQAAVTAYARIVETCRVQKRHEPKDPCGEAAFRKAQLLEQIGEAGAARAAFLEVQSVADPMQSSALLARSLHRAAVLSVDQLDERLRAVDLCRSVIQNYPREVAAEDALKLLVDLARGERTIDLRRELARIAAEHGAADALASFALFFLAKDYLDSGDLAHALNAYDEIWRRYPRGPLFDDALMEAAKLLRRDKRSAEAAARLETLAGSFTSAILIGHYNKLLLDESTLLLGEIYLNDLLRPQAAIDALSRLLTRQKTSLLCDDALLLMSEAALRRHGPPTDADVQEACRYLARLIVQYPDGNQVRRAKERQTTLHCAQRSAS